MKDKSFIIKIGDLLKETGRSDEIAFSQKRTTLVPGLTNKWIAGKIFLQSLSKDSIYADLQDITCSIDSVCDTCEASFVRKVDIHQYWAKFVLGEEKQKMEQEHSEEEIFSINPRDEWIDIEDMITQAIRLDEPIVNHCPSCAKIAETLPDEEDPDYFEGSSNIIIH